MRAAAAASRESNHPAARSGAATVRDRAIALAAIRASAIGA
jgi:hypothetical protein